MNRVTRIGKRSNPNPLTPLGPGGSHATPTLAAVCQRAWADFAAYRAPTFSIDISESPTLSSAIGSNPNAVRELDNREGKPMPWTAEDAERHTKKADSAKRQRMWADIANSVLDETGDEGRAIREANAMVGRDHEKSAGSS